MNVPYHSARMEGKIARAVYRAGLPLISSKPIDVAGELPFDVVSYSGEATLPEQIASIRSLLAHAGRPKQFTVVSDGSYTRGSIRLLEKVDQCVRVQTNPPVLPSDLPPAVTSYLAQHPTGKQVAVIMNLPLNGPVLYTDSDVLFFPEAKQLGSISDSNAPSAYYLPDYQFSGDERLIASSSEKGKPANTGFVFLFRKLDWSIALDRLSRLNGEPIFFTNQTLTHLALHASGALPFDPQKYILQVDDEFIYRDRYAGDSIVMRHYVNPIRHKFWAALAHGMFK